MSATNAVEGVASATAPNGGAPAAAPSAPFYASISDPEVRGYIENKGWKAPEDVVKSYREYEKSRGIPQDRLLTLPTDLNTAKPEELAPIYDRLGRPKDPTGYQFEKVDGADAEFEAVMRPTLHGLGLTQNQAAGLQKAFNAWAMESNQKAEATQQEEFKVADNDLHREWPGETYTQREQMARVGVREFVMPLVGGDTEKATAMLEKMEGALGKAAFLKLWSNVGERFGEGKFVGTNQPSSNFGMTPESATARKAERMADKDWAAKALKHGTAENNELARLNHIITGV